MKKSFAPGCALMIYKPYLAEKLHVLLNENLNGVDKLLTCCKHEPGFTEMTEVINICPGCHKRFNNDYPDTTAVSLWEVFAENNFFPFPDYKGVEMTILDACPTREDVKVHSDIRKLLARINIKVKEPQKTGVHGVCCGDSFFGVLPVEDVKKQMAKRASEMPAEDVVVYCISCIKSMHIGGRKPRYIVDLLFGEDTDPQIYEPELWHKQLDEYIEMH